MFLGIPDSVRATTATTLSRKFAISVVDLDEGSPSFTFASCVLQPGQRVRVYTNQVHPETGGFSLRYGRAVWNNREPDMAGL